MVKYKLSLKTFCRKNKHNHNNKNTVNEFFLFSKYIFNRQKYTL